MGIVYNPNANVQTADAASAASPLALTINGCTAGNTLFLAVCWGDTSSATGLSPPAAPSGFVTDVTTNTVGTASEAIGVVLYRSAGVTAGTHAVSLSFSGIGTAPYFWEAALFETTPVTLDKHPAVASSTTTSVTGPNTGTLSQSNEFAIGLCGANGAATPGIVSLPTGFTNILGGNGAGAGISGRIAQQITSVNTALNPAWTATGGASMAAIVATYTDASSGGKTLTGRPGLRLGTPVSRLRSSFRSFSASNITLSLTGQKITASAGTLIAARSLALTGGHITSSVGTIAPARSLSLTGQAISSHPGSLALSHAQGLTGGRITASAGTITASTVPVLTLALTGLRITSVAGNLQVAFNLNLTGSRINSAAGLLKANLGPSLSGVRINSSAGSLGVTRTAALSGVRINSATGTLTNAHTLGLTGARINSSAGSLTASQSFGVTVNLSGLRITASAGSLVSSGGTPSSSGNFSAGFICNVGTLANPDGHL